MVINSHKRLFQYNCLLFGVRSFCLFHSSNTNGGNSVHQHWKGSGSLETDKGNLEIWYAGFFFNKYVL